ncbi:MAG: hypothetical protein ABIK26_05315, partial [Candidatus Omnitrophota bacterium]
SPTGGGFHKPSRFGTISFGEMSLGSRMASLGHLQSGSKHLYISFSKSREKAEGVRVKRFVTVSVSPRNEKGGIFRQSAKREKSSQNFLL